MKRIVNKSRSFEAAAEWDMRQHLEMTPQQRIDAARELQRRVYKANARDVRECHKTN